MDAGVASQLGMKRGDQVAALFGPDRVAVIVGEDADFGADSADDGGADEDGFDRLRSPLRSAAWTMRLSICRP